MEPSYTSYSSEELVSQFHLVNAELGRHFSTGASWEQQQERIVQLNEISKELERRRIAPFRGRSKDRPDSEEVL